MFASRLRTRVFSVLFSSVNWLLSGSWSRHRVIFSKLTSEPVCSSQVDLHWASPHLPWGVQSICGPFFRICLSFKRFCQPACFFLLLDLHWDSPKLPWGIQWICGPFVSKTIIIIMPFNRLFVLWHTLTRSLYFIQVYIFIPPIIPPHSFALFTHRILHQFFAQIYQQSLKPSWLLFKWKPRMRQSCCFEVGCHTFLSGIHCKPLKLWKKKYREDLNRHFPQKINEFASLALAGRYVPSLNLWFLWRSRSCGGSLLWNSAPNVNKKKWLAHGTNTLLIEVAFIFVWRFW